MNLITNTIMKKKLFRLIRLIYSKLLFYLKGKQTTHFVSSSFVGVCDQQKPTKYREPTKANPQHKT